MFETPADTPWIWIGLTLATTVMFGVVVGVPTAAPNAERVATEIENVAASDHPGEASVEIRAEEVRLTPERIDLRGPGGRAHASIRYGPVTPVPPESILARVLDGKPPEQIYRSPWSFRLALETARHRAHRWQPAGNELQIRTVQFGEVNGVLVGA